MGSRWGGVWVYVDFRIAVVRWVGYVNLELYGGMFYGPGNVKSWSI